MEKVISDVLHIPGLAKNLFSAKQLDKAGGKIRIKFGQLEWINKFGQTIANCNLNPDLYELGTTIIPQKRIMTIHALTNMNKAGL